MKTKAFAVALALALFAPALPAQTVTPPNGPRRPLNIQQRRQLQQHRIAQGINSGSLTPREAARLERQEANLNRREARMMASGGRFTRGERNAIRHQQNNLSRRIYQQKHDRQHR